MLHKREYLVDGSPRGRETFWGGSLLKFLNWLFLIRCIENKAESHCVIFLYVNTNARIL